MNGNRTIATTVAILLLMISAALCLAESPATAPPTQSSAAPSIPATQPATQPGAEPAVRPGIATTQPTTRPAVAETQPTTRPAVAATQPATQPAIDARAEALERHKHIDPRWRQIQESQRSSARTRWTDAKVSRTFKPNSLVRLSLAEGLLKAQTADVATAAPLRVAVEGSKAIWTLSHPRAAAAIGGGTGFVSVSRFDFDAPDEDSWHTTLVTNDGIVNIFAQSIFENFRYVQNKGQITVVVLESIHFAQAPQVLFTARASSISDLRGRFPEEFRMYVLPMLSRFGDVSFLQPGPADVYTVFTEIAADPKVCQQLDLLIPQLDADDPVDREAASAKLHQLDGPGVLAVLRMDESGLSEEQKRRLQAFVSTFRRRPPADPVAQRRDLEFLIDCLEFNDAAVRDLARAELQKCTGKPIDFDIHLTGDAVNKATDELRKQLLIPPPPRVSLPSTNPAPEV